VRAFQTRRSGCSFIHADGGRRNPVFSAAALMPSAGIASLINRRFFWRCQHLRPDTLARLDAGNRGRRGRWLLTQQ